MDAPDQVHVTIEGFLYDLEFPVAQVWIEFAKRFLGVRHHPQDNGVRNASKTTQYIARSKTPCL